MWYLGFTCSRARSFKLVQSWLWHFKPTRTVKKFGWLPWNWRVKTMKIREQGMSYSQVFVFLWILEKICESRNIIIKGTKVLSPGFPQARRRAVCLLLENAKKKQLHARCHTQSHANSHAHSHAHSQARTLTCICVFPHGFPSKKETTRKLASSHSRTIGYNLDQYFVSL